MDGLCQHERVEAQVVMLSRRRGGLGRWPEISEGRRRQAHGLQLKVLDFIRPVDRRKWRIGLTRYFRIHPYLPRQPKTPESQNLLRLPLALIAMSTNDLRLDILSVHLIPPRDNIWQFMIQKLMPNKLIGCSYDHRSLEVILTWSNPIRIHGSLARSCILYLVFGRGLLL